MKGTIFSWLALSLSIHEILGKKTTGFFSFTLELLDVILTEMSPLSREADSNYFPRIGSRA